jgi:hypothetical protein
VPDEAEAYAIIDNESEDEDFRERPKDRNLNEAIVKALVAYNPKLEVFGLNNKGDDDDAFDSIEIEHPEEVFNLQIFVQGNHVSFHLPCVSRPESRGDI